MSPVRTFASIAAIFAVALSIRGTVPAKGHVPLTNEALVPGCYAILEGDTLRLGNSRIERVFAWNGGHLMTVSLTDKDARKTLYSSRLQPDFSLGKHTDSSRGESPSFRIEEVAQADVHEAHLQIIVEYGLGHVRIRKVLRVYPDVPAIACTHFLKGQAAVTEGAALDRVSFPGRHWRMEAVRFRDVTDVNDNLVQTEKTLSYKRQKMAGNLLFARDGVDGSGFWLLKEAPCGPAQLHYQGHDFACSFGDVAMEGIGMTPEDLADGQWVPAYGSVLGVFDGGQLPALLSLQAYQKTVRRHLDGRDEMIMMNTWGDRNRDTRLNEAFCKMELEKGARLGITHFQIDDGWQTGRSPASALQKGSFQDIWKNPRYWEPDPEKYPQGLSSVVQYGRSLGIEPGLWFNPSCQDDLADWENDADVVLGLYRAYDIRYFKIDGLQVPTKRAEGNLRRFLEKVRQESGGRIVINLDVTAGRRPGYFQMGGYGNIFLENRYTDFGSYYPYRTLRNLWQLARYVPAERLQVEFLNKWRNQDKYPADDPFAPSRYDFSYLFATTMAAQPLAWLEASNLPEEAFGIAPLVKGYREIMSQWHRGTILPIGSEPSGRSWTGFQSILSPEEGFLLIYREDTPEPAAKVPLWLPEGKRVRCTPLLGEGKRFTAKAGSGGTLSFRLPRPNSFAMYRYEVL